jgi:hypothetical protein
MSYFSEVLADAPLAYWRLGEPSGGVAADASGYGRVGTYQNGPALGESGALGTDVDTAARFDGSDDRIDLAGVPALGTTFSIELWLKWDSGADSYQTLIGQANGTFSLFIRNDGRLDLFYSAADHHFVPALQPGVWQHVVVSVAAGAATCYVNGASIGTAASAPAGFQPDRIANNTAGDTFKGWLDEIALYATALPAARVVAHYAAAYPGLTNLVYRLRQLLKDTDATSYRWTDEELRRHLQRAVDELSQVLPDEQKTALSTTPGSRDLSLAALDGLLDIEAVEFPAGLYPAAFAPFQTWGSTLTLLVEQAPAGAEDVIVYWNGRHRVEARSSTLPHDAEELVVTGAAGHAAEAWAAFATNRANVSGAAAVDDFHVLAVLWLGRFQEQLRRLGRAGRIRPANLYAPARPMVRDTVQW